MTEADHERLYRLFAEVMTRVPLVAGQQIVVALGGGADSQSLLDCLMRFRQQQPQYRYLAIHLDHAFHPDSGDWSDTIEKAVAAYSVEHIFEPLPVALVSRQSKEAAGREQRYQRLAELTDDNAVILLGQHRNDQIETFLLQLKRGSGPKGLAAMAEIQPWQGQRTLVRPLLRVSKADILSYAQHHQLTWIEDDTNYDTTIERNFLRHQVIPILEQRWPQMGDSVLRSARLCAEQQQVLETLVDEKLQQQQVEHPLLGLGLPVDALKHYSQNMQRVLLRRWLEVAAEQQQQSIVLPSYQQLEQIREQAGHARADSRMVVECSDYNVRFYQMALWLDVQRRTFLGSHLPLPQQVESAGIIGLPEPWGQVTIASELLALGPLRWQTAELKCKLCHPQRRGSKMLRDWLKAYQVPAWLRSSTPVLEVAEEWLYVPMIGWLSRCQEPAIGIQQLTAVTPCWSGYSR